MSTLESNESLQKLSQRMSLLSEKPGYRALFEHKKLLAAQKDQFKPYTMAIHRSLPFDWVERVLNVYSSMWQADIQPCFYSSYDPALLSLSTATQDNNIQTADIQLVWVDWRLLIGKQTPENAVQWITAQLKILREQTTAPILINNWPDGNANYISNQLQAIGNNAERQWIEKLNACLNTELGQAISNTHIIDLQQIAVSLGQAFWDIRNDLVSHYPFSDNATVEIAKHIGCQLLPALFDTRKKAIILDMDETLYKGILGEDGIDGVTLTEAHVVFQRCLKQLQVNGFLLALCSRNNINDAQALFETRNDFVLQWSDFVTTYVNWDAKSTNIQTIAETLNVHYNSFIFIDDNPVELLQVTSVLPELTCILADKDALKTTLCLAFTPGVYTLQKDDVANKRQQDIQAQAERKNLLANSHGNIQHYLTSLKMQVMLFENHTEHTHRLHDLSQRTNQFNLTSQRLDASKAEQAMGNNYCTLTVGLSDSLSDSGIIGAFIAEIKNNNAELIECVMSCRALGREVETIAFCHLLERLQQQNIKTLTLTYTVTDRNQPAYEWLCKLAHMCNETLNANSVTINIDSALSHLKPIVAKLPVEITIENSFQGASLNEH